MTNQASHLERAREGFRRAALHAGVHERRELAHVGRDARGRHRPDQALGARRITRFGAGMQQRAVRCGVGHQACVLHLLECLERARDIPSLQQPTRQMLNTRRAQNDFFT